MTPRTLTVLAAGALAAAGLTLTGLAGAQTLPPPVTDYANYPDTAQALLTDGCDFSGIEGVTYTSNGGPSEAALADLEPFASGDVVTMSWAAVTPACVGSAVSMAIKDASFPAFDPSDNQTLVGYNTMFAADGPGSFTFTLPSVEVFQHGCNYQFDAIVGVPLSVVGPTGSFYSESLRGDGRRTTLIQSRNGTYTTCTPDETTTTTTTGETTTSTTSTGSTTTTPPTSTTSPPAGDTPNPPTADTPPTGGGTTPHIVRSGTPTEFPITGAHSGLTAAAGAAAILAGVALLVGRRWAGVAVWMRRHMPR